MLLKQGNERIVMGRMIKDAQYSEVGAKKTPKCTLAVSYGPREADGGGIANVVAWGTLARECARGKKGDHVIAGGKQESREYNGKTYTDINSDFALVVCAADYERAMLDDLDEIEVNEDELPF